MEKISSKPNSETNKPKQLPNCLKHEGKPIKKICLIKDCETPLLSEELLKSHPFGHVSRTKTIEDITNRKKILTRLKKKVGEIKKRKAEEVDIELKAIEEALVKEVRDTFKGLRGKFDQLFDEKVESILVGEYQDYVDLYNQNKGSDDLQLMRDMYIKYVELGGSKNQGLNFFESLELYLISVHQNFIININ